MATDLIDENGVPFKKTTEQMFGASTPTVGSGLYSVALPASVPDKTPQIGRDENGVITADTAKAAMAAPMERSGGIFGSIDMKGANEILARENAARQSMINSQVGGGTGKPVSWQDQHGNESPEKQRIAESNALLNKWDSQYQTAQAMQEVARNPKAAPAMAGIFNGAQQAESTRRGQDLSHSAAMAAQGLTARGQDLNAMSDSLRTMTTMRGQDINANTDAQRLGIDRSRLGIQQSDADRANAKWSIESGIIKGQAADADAVRGARTELAAATLSGDQKKIEAAKAKALAYGIQPPKSDSHYTLKDNPMGGYMVLDQNSGSGMTVDAKGKQTPFSASARPQAVPDGVVVPKGHSFEKMANGRPVFRDAKGNLVVDDGK